MENGTLFAGYTVIDLETTGFQSKHHRAIEIAVVTLDPAGRIEDQWSTLLQPDRDIANSHIHGIRPSDLVEAPRFQDIAERLVRSCQNRILVAHNADFDYRFLRSEFFKATQSDWPDLPSLCTMQLATNFLRVASRKLDICCEAAGIHLSNAHSAMGDAQATAELFRYYLQQLKMGTLPWHEFTLATTKIVWPELETSSIEILPRSLTPVNRAEDEWLNKIVSSTSRASAPEVESYIAALETYLLDYELSNTEKNQLIQIAAEFGITRNDLKEIHLSAFKMMVFHALEDDVIDEFELAKLTTLAAALGIPAETTLFLLNNPPSADYISDLQIEHSTQKLTLSPGDKIVFTGSMKRSREVWDSLATAKGLITGSITKSTKLVIAADPDSMSGKAAKARSYGIPIISEEAWEHMYQKL